MPKTELPKIRFGLLDLIRQFIVLVQRSLSVLFSDPVTLMLMLLLLPLTGTLQLVIGSKEVLTGNLSILADPVAAAKTLVENYAPYAKTNTFVFVMGLEAVLTGEENLASGADDAYAHGASLLPAKRPPVEVGKRFKRRRGARWKPGAGAPASL